MADITLSSIVGQPRRQIFTLTASNASFPIPSWAQGGKGIVYVTGCGGGGSGGITDAVDGDYGGGAAGGYCIRHPVIIPSGQTTAAVVIGAAGAAVVATVDADGNSGSSTTLTIGSAVLTLEGGNGGGGSSEQGGVGGAAYMGSVLNKGTNNQTPAMGVTNQTSTFYPNFPGFNAPPATLAFGAPGASGIDPAAGNNAAGGYSMFGQGGQGFTANAAALTNGQNATGYGAGGSGACDFGSGSNATSGAGSPGILILEFTEAF